MKKISVDGRKLRDGIISGKLVYLREYSDLNRVNADSLIFLDGCSKHVAVIAMHRSKASIKFGESDTSHLMLSIPLNYPFAIVFNWDSSIKEGTYIELDLKKETFSAVETKEKNPVVFIKDVDFGQKTARLLYLSNLGFRIPKTTYISFSDIKKYLDSTSVGLLIEDFLKKENPSDSEILKTYEKINSEINSGLIKKIKFTPNLEFPLAVRSSANLEDGSDNLFAGVFESKLNVTKKNLIHAIVSVLVSTYNVEVLSVYKEKLKVIKQSILIQEMVRDPLISGAVFINQFNNNKITVEGVFCNYAENLMSGSKLPDIKVELNLDLTFARIVVNNTIKSKEELTELLIGLCEEALEIYKQIGCDDLEFVISKDCKITWVQARSLPNVKRNIVAEKLNKFEFFDNLNKSLHFRCWEANQIKNIKKNYIVKGNAVSVEHKIEFGKVDKIKRMKPMDELLFNNVVQNDLSILKRLTRSGNNFLKWMDKKSDLYFSTNLNESYNLLAFLTGLRGGSFGIRSRFKKQFNTEEWKKGKDDTIEKILSKVIKYSKLNLSVRDAYELMYISSCEPVVLTQQKLILNILRKKKISRPSLINYSQFQLRKAMNLNSSDFESFLNKYRLDIENTTIGDVKNNIHSLEAEISLKKHLYTEFINCAKKCLSKYEFDLLRGMAKFIEMKTTANEKNVIFRGKIFMSISKKLTSKNLDHNNLTFDELGLIGINKENVFLVNMKPVLNKIKLL